MSMLIDVEIGEKERRVDIFNGEQRLVFISDNVTTKVLDNKGESVFWVESHISFDIKYPSITELVKRFLDGSNLGFDKHMLVNQRHTYHQLLSEYIEIVEGKKTPPVDSNNETEWVKLPLGGISGNLSTSKENGDEVVYEIHRKIKQREFVTHIVKRINQKNQKDLADCNKIEDGHCYQILTQSVGPLTTICYHILTQSVGPLTTIEEIEQFLCEHVREYKS